MCIPYRIKTIHQLHTLFIKQTVLILKSKLKKFIATKIADNFFGISSFNIKKIPYNAFIRSRFYEALLLKLKEKLKFTEYFIKCCTMFGSCLEDLPLVIIDTL